MLNKTVSTLKTFFFFLYTMFSMWVPECSWFFNIYNFTAYTFMIIIRKYQTAKLDELDTSL